MDKDDDPDATFVCIMISATTLQNLFAELSEILNAVRNENTEFRRFSLFSVV